VFSYGGVTVKTVVGVKFTKFTNSDERYVSRGRPSDYDAAISAATKLGKGESLELDLGDKDIETAYVALRQRILNLHLEKRMHIESRHLKEDPNKKVLVIMPRPSPYRHKQRHQKK